MSEMLPKIPPAFLVLFLASMGASLTAQEGQEGGGGGAGTKANLDLLIIYLSDGGQTCAGADPAVYGAECLAEVTQRNVQRVRINTICIGPDGEVDEEWMRRLASENGGQYARFRIMR